MPFRLRLTRLFDLLLITAAALLGGRLAGAAGDDPALTLAALAVGLLAAGAGLGRAGTGVARPFGLGLALLGAVCGFAASALTGVLALAVAPATVVYLTGLRSAPVARPLAGGGAAALAVLAGALAVDAPGAGTDGAALAPWGALLAFLLVAARELARRVDTPVPVVPEGEAPVARPHRRRYGFAALSGVGLVVIGWPLLPAVGFDPAVLVGGMPVGVCLLAAVWMLLAVDAHQPSAPTEGGRWAAVWLDAALVSVGGALVFGL